MPQKRDPYFRSPSDYGDDAHHNPPRSISEYIDRGSPPFFLYDQVSGRKIGHVDSAGVEHFIDEEEKVSV